MTSGMSTAVSSANQAGRSSHHGAVPMAGCNTPELVALLQDTPKLSALDLDEYDAIMVAGGQAPMFSFRANEHVHDALRRFYESEKPT
jgi:putative intracellular protease/amidase